MSGPPRSTGDVGRPPAAAQGRAVGVGAPDEALGTGCVVVGVDRRAESVEALRVAKDLARRLGVDLVVVHVVDLADYPVDPDADDWGVGAEATLAGEAAAVRSLMEGWEGRWSYQAVRGDPAAAISRAAQGRRAALVVVGAPRSRHRWERPHPAAVAHRLIGHCPRPVLVVTA